MVLWPPQFLHALPWDWAWGYRAKSKWPSQSSKWLYIWYL